MSPQIHFDQVWKRYRLRWRAGGRLRYAIRDWFEEKRSRQPESRVAQNIWAIKDVTLGIAHGDSLGVIGDNGAGKSTLLKLISGVTYPTRGRVTVRGRVGALVDVGAGMHPDLTGSENIYLYGSILGLPRREIRRRFGDIVDFSELSTFLDVPLKRYSSGMKIRLGFAVAAFMDPDILLIDEVLAVGDIAFQRKCIDRIQMLQDGGTTIVYVSHDLSTVERICQRAAWMEGGQIREIAESTQLISHYRSFVDQRFVETARKVVREKQTVRLERIVLVDSEGRPREEFSADEHVTIQVHYRNGSQTGSSVEVHLKVVPPGGRTLILTSSGVQTLPASSLPGTLQCHFDSIPLAPGIYQVWGRVVRFPDRIEEIPWQPVAGLTVGRSALATDRTPIMLHPSERPILDVPVHWSMDGAAAEQEDPESRP